MPPPAPQWIVYPTKSVCARLRAAVPGGEIWDSASLDPFGEPAPKTLVMSPVGSVAVTLTWLPLACALVSGAVRTTPVPAAPAVPTLAIVASSWLTVPFSSTIVWPAARPLMLLTLMFVSPAVAAAASDVGAGDVRNAIAVLFSSTALAVPTLPTSQPARVNGTHGAGALRTVPEPPRDAGSVLTML